MRWVLPVLLAMAMLLPPSSLGQEVGGEVPEIITDATLHVVHPIAPTSGAITGTMPESLPVPATEEQIVCSQPAGVTYDAGVIQFDEATENNGCAWVTFNLTIPEGAALLQLQFNASRTVVTPATDLLSDAVLIDQAVYLGAADEGNSHANDVYIPRQISNVDPQVINEPRFPITGVGNSTLLTFWFHDVGSNQISQQAAIATGQAVSARVHSIEAIFPAISVGAIGGATISDRQNLSAVEEKLTISQVVNLPAVVADAAVATLEFKIRGDSSFIGGFDAEGNAGNFLSTSVTDVGGGIRLVTVEIDAATMLSAYEWRFSQIRAIPVPPIQYGDYGPMYLLALGFGAVASGGAAYSTAKYNRIAQGSYRTSAVRMAIGLAVLVLYFLFQAIYTWVVITPQMMNRNPLPSQALTFYVQMLLVILALGSLWYIVARTEVRRMRSDIKERQEREDELKRSNAELEQFAYVASHDLQEPLRKVASYTQLLQRKYKGELDAEANEFIEYAVSGAKRMQNLITDILQFSRVGQNELVVAPVDLNDVLKDIRSDLQVKLDETKGRITFKDLPTISTDLALLRQLLYNLVNNGIKFHRATARPLVRVSSEQIDGGYRLRIADNGIGIAKEHHERIFSVFKRLHRHEEYAGTGIGLALCRKISDLLGGTIAVESEVGRGSTFILELPAALP